ncbi:hypothetical protein SO802_017525 [Lithocarpus litseifolius]|uniref:Retrotransposon gag domain-containing protein n=1 Tax=Lithocarpus litseifolius TaxID=425828 RepID=A0AAW2CKJ1_9ROSI
MLAQIFQNTLTGAALRWFLNIEDTRARNWEDICREFHNQYKYNIEDLTKKGKHHNDPLHITVDAKGKRIPMVLIDDGSALNVCPLKITSCLGLSIEDFMSSDQHVKAYDNNRREVLGTITLELTIGPMLKDPYEARIDNKDDEEGEAPSDDDEGSDKEDSNSDDSEDSDGKDNDSDDSEHSDGGDNDSEDNDSEGSDSGDYGSQDNGNDRGEPPSDREDEDARGFYEDNSYDKVDYYDEDIEDDKCRYCIFFALNLRSRPLKLPKY